MLIERIIYCRCIRTLDFSPLRLRASMRLIRPRRQIRPRRRLLPFQKARMTLTAMKTKKMMANTRMTSTPRQHMVVMTKTKTPCTLRRQGRRVMRKLTRSHYYPRIRIATTMAMTLAQAMMSVRRRTQEVSLRNLTGQATDSLASGPPRKRRRQFWLRLMRPATSSVSWWPMAWMKSLRSNS